MDEKQTLANGAVGFEEKSAAGVLSAEVTINQSVKFVKVSGSIKAEVDEILLAEAVKAAIESKSPPVLQALEEAGFKAAEAALQAQS